MDNYHLCLPNMPQPKNYPLKACGENVRIFHGVHIVGPEFIEIGSDVIIDTGAIIIASAECPIKIGSFVHIGAHSSVGGGPITFGDFSGISHGVRLVGGDEDYRGRTPTNPTIPRELRRVSRAGVHLAPHVVIGANSVIMPGIIPEGVAIGALSFVPSKIVRSVDGSLDADYAMVPWTIWAGSPAQKIGKREPINATAATVRGFK